VLTNSLCVFFALLIRTTVLATETVVMLVTVSVLMSVAYTADAVYQMHCKKNNETSAELTTANGGTFTSFSAIGVARGCSGCTCTPPQGGEKNFFQA